MFGGGRFLESSRLSSQPKNINPKEIKSKFGKLNTSSLFRQLIEIDSLSDEDIKTIEKLKDSYDMPDMVQDGDVHVFGDMKVAWFKDHDGNILNITSR
jgi:hypothetical protein